MEMIKEGIQINWIRNFLLLCMSICLSNALATNAMAAEDIIVKGGKMPWSGRLTSGWIGGNAKQIERIISESNHPALVEIMREMLLDAQVLDVYFTHLDVTGISSRTLSTIRVNTIPKHLQLDDMAARKAFWNAYADLERADTGSGSEIVLEEDHAAKTGGFQAYQASFKINLAKGGVFYKIVNIVELPNNISHIFELKADINKIRSRQKEFDNMLFSVHYR